MTNPRFPSENYTGGQFLEFWIRYRDLTLTELCSRVGVDPKVVERILKGNQPLLPSYLVKILDELGLSIQPNPPQEVYEDEL